DVMSFESTVYEILIYAPGDVQEEKEIIEEIIEEWNMIHSKREKITLIPKSWERHSLSGYSNHRREMINKQVAENADLLVAVFWTMISTPTGEADSGTVEELEQYIDSGIPVLVYQASKHPEASRIDQTQYWNLLEFLNNLESRKTYVHQYNTLTVFRELFKRQLSQTMNKNFAVNSEIHADHINAASNNSLISGEAKKLLIDAAQDPSGVIIYCVTAEGTRISTNNKDFSEPGNPESELVWYNALEELTAHGFVNYGDIKSQVYKMTREGFEYVDQISIHF
ncbi:MAG: hypothetical protein KGY69_16875, partial [Bacteroidales bacterium]|nr:hypothetical protein [Bacteroidales bacterium]